MVLLFRLKLYFNYNLRALRPLKFKNLKGDKQTQAQPPFIHTYWWMGVGGLLDLVTIKLISAKPSRN